MTINEAIETVARQALVDNVPTDYFPFEPLTLDEVVASARVRGRAAEMDSRHYADADNYVIDVAYADKGYRAMYEVGPETDPILWMN